jgi:hypothetical protein
MSRDFFGLLGRLVKGGVDFVVVGGFAGVAHGCTYVTADIDICIDLAADNLLRLQEALAGLNPVHRMTPRRMRLRLTRANCAQIKNLYLDTDMGQLDCVGAVAGVGDYASVKKASEAVTVEGVSLWVLKIGALIESKKAINRAKDVAAIKELEAIRKMREKK